MSCHDWNARLHDYVDDALAPAERREVGGHLDSCRACRESLGRIEALIHAAQDLPREIEPARDLWPAIRRQAAPLPTARPRSVRWLALAASLLLISLATLVALRDTGGGRSPQTGTGAAMPVTADTESELFAAEQEYAEATRLLMAAIEQRKGSMSPELQAVLERNLGIIDRAIEEVRTAVAAEPADPTNEVVLASMYEQKLTFLKRFVRLGT